MHLQSPLHHHLTFLSTCIDSHDQSTQDKTRLHGGRSDTLIPLTSIINEGEAVRFRCLIISGHFVHLIHRILRKRHFHTKKKKKERKVKKKECLPV